MSGLPGHSHQPHSLPPHPEQSGHASPIGLRVLVADDQLLVGAGIRMLLSQEPDIDVAALVADGCAAVEAAQDLAPDVIVMDVHLPLLDGVEATRRIMAAGRAIPVVIIANRHEESDVYAALRAGAAGFLLKDAVPDDLIRAVRLCAAGHGWLDPVITRNMLAEFASRPEQGARPMSAVQVLTRREQEILTLVALGLSNQDLARRLYIAEGTVKTHITRVLMKLGLRTRAEAVALAYQSGLVTVSRPEPRPEPRPDPRPTTRIVRLHAESHLGRMSRP